jgi:predicted transcriptional regulator
MEVSENEKGNKMLNLDTLLEIIGNPTRRIILSKLAKVPLGASELAASFGAKISRQAIHTQLKSLEDDGIIESIGSDPRDKKYRIKSNLSLRIDITPDYYNVQYSLSKIDKKITHHLSEAGYKGDYDKIKKPNQKIRFLGEKIREIEKSIHQLENERSELLHDKQCLIVELKNMMAKKYEQNLIEENPNLEKEIFYTIFYNPMRYSKRINIDNLLDDLFFSKMGDLRRDQHKLSIQYLLNDLSKVMDLFKQDDDDSWFFDI